MKKALLILIWVAYSVSLWAQTPNGFNYQAVARNSEGEPLVNQSISLRISILSDNAAGSVVYSETHQTTTNDFGLFTLIIGEGTVESGSMSQIDWGNRSLFVNIEMDAEGESNFVEMGTAPLLSVPYALHAKSVSNADDADADSLNEIQDLQLTDNTLTITLNNNATEVDLTPYLNNTDEQSLSINGHQLNLNNGGSVMLPDTVNADGDIHNEIQDLHVSNDTLTITMNDQATKIDLKPYLDNTDEQTLSLNGNELVISNGNSVYFSETVDLDADPENELQDLHLNGNILTITLNDTATNIDLSPYLDNTDQQTLLINGHQLTLSNGNTVMLPDTVSADDDAGNEIQDLQLANDTLTITLNNNPSQIDLKPYLDNTDGDSQNEIQDLQLTNDTLTITLNGNPTQIDLKPYLDNTDDQILTYTNDTLSISNGNDLVLPYDSSNWYVKGDNIFYNKGKVGIGNSKPGSKLEVQADPASTDADTLFAVKDRDGNTVFAVFPDGAKVYAGSSAKGRVGGFAVSGRSATKGIEHDYLRVTPDSTHVYVNDSSVTKGRVGGFAVSGRSATKGVTRDIMFATIDSTRIYVNDGSSSKGRVGGFAVSGRSATKGTSSKFLQLNSDNYFIGQESGSNITTGLYNSFFGYQAGKSNTSGSNNVFLGYLSGFSNLGANNNVFIGNESGYNITSGYGNVYVGYESGRNDTMSYYNSFTGYQTGLNNSGNYNSFYGFNSGRTNTGNYNSFYGPYAGYTNKGNYNAFIGYGSGYGNQEGSNNVFLGNYSGYGNTTGNRNVMIGYLAGRFNSSASSNVFIGYRSGYYNTYGGVTNDQGAFNTFLGYEAGFNNRTGQKNTALGFSAGHSLSSGSNNVLIGNLSGYTLDAGINNVMVGDSAGYASTSAQYSVFMGEGAGKNNTTGNYNTLIGYQAGYNTGGSNFTTAMGYQAGYSISSWQAGTYIGYLAGKFSTGRTNVFLGARAGEGFTTGADNVVVGKSAGGTSQETPTEGTGDRNTFLGWFAGYDSGNAADNVIVGAQNFTSSNPIQGANNVYLGVNAGNESGSASSNVFIGYNAGLNETNSNRLYIENSSANSASALIYGEFDNDLLTINGDLKVNSSYFHMTGDPGSNATPSNYVYQGGVAGSVAKQYAFSIYDALWVTNEAWFDDDVNAIAFNTLSDKRFKKTITPIENPIDKISRMRGVYYHWNNDNKMKRKFRSDKRQIGFIAQELEEIIPEVVSTNEDGYKSVNYPRITSLLVEAVKEQQKENSQLRNELDELKRIVGQLQNQIEESKP